MSEPKRTLVGSRHLRFLVGVGCALGLAACNANIDGSGNGPAVGAGAAPGCGGGSNMGPGADPNAVGSRPLNRLSRREYNNTVRDLLGDTTNPADAFPDDRDRSFLFRRAGLVATQDADLLRTAAE